MNEEENEGASEGMHETAMNAIFGATRSPEADVARLRAPFCLLGGRQPCSAATRVCCAGAGRGGAPQLRGEPGGEVRLLLRRSEGAIARIKVNE